jgi:hypothetical protein
VTPERWDLPRGVIGSHRGRFEFLALAKYSQVNSQVGHPVTGASLQGNRLVGPPQPEATGPYRLEPQGIRAYRLGRGPNPKYHSAYRVRGRLWGAARAYI